MGDATQILRQINDGDPFAADELLPIVYAELRKLAAARLAKEKPGQTIQATALVHDAYIRLVDVQQAQQWDSRGHFFAAAAESMRRIVVENCRRKSRQKHGGDRRRVDLNEACLVSRQPSDELLAIDEALERFSRVAPEKAAVVKLRYFAGMTIPETADALGISRATAERYWTYARLWLYSELEQENGDDLDQNNPIV
ncbi:MAG: ECF-type sigma factor [Pirellulaceae bacterium]